jgi:hypothetical protein
LSRKAIIFNPAIVFNIGGIGFEVSLFCRGSKGVNKVQAAKKPRIRQCLIASEPPDSDKKKH